MENNYHTNSLKISIQIVSRAKKNTSINPTCNKVGHLSDPVFPFLSFLLK
jgi:hypothetical protein